MRLSIWLPRADRTAVLREWTTERETLLAGQALNVINSTLAGVEGLAAQKAAALKADADIIAQQTRLARCRADPTTCK
jgi:hypothetical protein